MSKNAAQRALLMLRRHELVIPSQLRRGDGIFAEGMYALVITPDVLEPVVPDAAQRKPVQMSRPPTLAQASRPVEQLALLPLV